MDSFADERGPVDAAPIDADEALRSLRDHAAYTLDARGRAASWSPQVASLLGWPESDWIGQPVALGFTAEDCAAGVPTAELARAALHGRAEDERWMLRRDGVRFYAVSTLTCLRDPLGRVTGFLKVLRDASAARHAADECVRLLAAEREARARAEQQHREWLDTRTALSRRDAQFRAIVEAVTDYAIFTIDPDGLISSWHPGAQRMKGYSAEEAVGMPFAALFTAEDRSAGAPQHAMEQAARTGEHHAEGRRLRRNGEVFDAAVVLTALRGPAGELLGFLKLTQDITTRKQQQRERDEMLENAQSARDAAERASRSKNEFLATISHELRTPLGAILGWAHVLENTPPGPDILARGLSAISRNARVQVQLIEDLLDMNRIESGQLRLEMRPVRLGPLVHGVVESVQPLAAQKGLVVRLEADPSVGTVSGDAARLEQVLWNLLSNAVKFTPPEGEIVVTLRRAGRHGEIGVVDTGQGIEAEFLARVFDRFRQQDAQPTRRHGGLGLGLSIVKQLTQLHGGQVRAESEGPGRGSRFTVSLPLRPDGAGDAYPPSSASQDPAPSPPLPVKAPPVEPLPGLPRPHAASRPLEGRCVLLVDDEPDVRAMAEYVLRDAGARVLAASGAQEGFALFCEHRPDAIVSDIGMPVHDGFDLMRWIRGLDVAHGGATPAAAFTAYARPQDRERTRGVGFQAHLVKPVEPRELVGAVAALLRAVGLGPLAPGFDAVDSAAL